MPSFIAAIEPLPTAQTIERNVRGFFSFFSLRKEKNTFLSFSKEKDMYFSPQGEKIPKELLRLPPQTPMLLLGKRIPTVPNRRNRAPTCALRHSPCESSVPLGSPRPQAQSCRSALSVRTNDRTERSRFLFVLFLSDGEKNIFLFFRNQLFLPAHIRTKRGGHVHRAVGIQIVFKESDEHSRRGDDRVVERMREIFFAVRAVYADF